MAVPSTSSSSPVPLVDKAHPVLTDGPAANVPSLFTVRSVPELDKIEPEF